MNECVFCLFYLFDCFSREYKPHRGRDHHLFCLVLDPQTQNSACVMAGFKING